MLKREIEIYEKCEPYAMAHNQSRNAIMFAFEDMRADVLALHAENERFREVMRMIAFPRRGTPEEDYSLLDMAKLIQSAYSAEDLWNDIAQKKSDQSTPLDNSK